MPALTIYTSDMAKNLLRKIPTHHTKKLRLALAVVLICGFLVSCNQEPSSTYRGGLVFVQGSYLMRLSIGDGSLSVEGHLGDTVIREISAFGGNHLLIAETASVNRRRVQRVSWFDLNTGETADLYAGTRARYLPAGNVVVYDDGSDLFAVPQIDGSANQVIYSHSKNQLSWMTVASESVLLFESGEPGEKSVYAWNSISGDLDRLDALTQVCRLEGSVWIDSLERLACKTVNAPPASAPYILADLEGNSDGPLGLPPERSFLALSYIDGQDALVLQERAESMIGSRDQYLVWVQDILTGELHRVPGNINLGDSVVYADY